MERGVVESDGNERDAVLRPVRGIDRSHVRSIWAQANRLLKAAPARLRLDLTDAPHIDAAGVALVRELEERCLRDGIAFSVTGAAPAVAEFIGFVRGRSAADPRPVRARRPPFARRLRPTIERWGNTLGDFVEFVGNFAKSAAYLVTHPHRFRFGEVAWYVQRAGADGMLLVTALSLLLGIVMAFQGLSGTRGFGSPIFVADVVAISTVREMAPLLTGVVVTGRSGAAIAAEIGTMKIDQELDALSVMGLDVMRFLLVPRTVAVVFSTPLLTLLSIGFGILGGAAVAVFALHLSLVSYFSETRGALEGTQVIFALVKGAVFGLMIGVIACFQGLQAGHAAEDVGKQTTSAVVKGILLVIFADAFFSIAGEVYGW
jgi:phospholipid/cholesterol/gamma-HCH transport system permease protein